MSDVSASDPVSLSLNRIGHLVFLYKGASEPVPSIELTAGASDPYLLKFYDIYVACTGGGLGFQACFDKWRRTPLVLELMQEKKLELKFGVRGMHGNLDDYGEWSIAKYFIISLGQRGAGRRPRSTLADAVLKTFVEAGDDFFQKLQHGDVQKVMQHSEAKAKAEKLARESAEAEALDADGAKDGPQGGGEGQAAAVAPTPAVAAGPSGSRAAAVAARQAEMARGKQPVLVGVPRDTTSNEAAVVQGGGEGQAAAELPTPPVAAQNARRAGIARGKRPLVTGTSGDTTSKEDAVMQEGPGVNVPVCELATAPPKRRKRLATGNNCASSSRPPTKRQQTPPAQKLAEEAASKKMKSSGKAIKDKKDEIEERRRRIIVVQGELDGLMTTQTTAEGELTALETLHQANVVEYAKYAKPKPKNARKTKPRRAA